MGRQWVGWVTGAGAGWVSYWAAVMRFVSSVWSYLKKSMEVFNQSLYMVRKSRVSPGFLSRKARSKSSVREEMMWSGGAVGLVEGLDLGIDPRS